MKFSINDIVINDIVIEFRLEEDKKRAYISKIRRSRGLKKHNSKSDCGVIIPDKVVICGEEYVVSGFSKYFSLCPGIKKITIPETITILGEYTFSCRKDLEEVILPSNLTIIGSRCFMNCKNLKTVVIPDDSKLKIIHSHAFRGCKALKTIDLPDELENINEYAFKYSGIERIIFPKKVTLKYGCFLYCRNLRYVEFKGDLIKQLYTHFELIFPKNYTAEFIFDMSILLKKYSIPLYKIDRILKRTMFRSISDFLELMPEGDGLVVGPLLRGGINMYQGKYYIPNNVILARHGKLKSIPIIRIEDFAFSNCSNLKSVEISEGISYRKDLVFFNSSCEVL